jgi:hypothetical protein
MKSARLSAMGGFAGLALALSTATATAQPPATARPPAKQAVGHAGKAPAADASQALRGAALALPEPELRVRVIAPSAEGPWTMRLENEGMRWLRVPADIRLLHLTVEDGDTMSKRPEKPLKCGLPAAMRPEGFPESNAVLLGPGDAYVESFDPRLFCFGKEAKAIAGGALVRATYGWEPPKGAAKLAPPYVVEGTVYPAAVQPKKHLVAPSFVLSWLPQHEHEESHAADDPAFSVPPDPAKPPADENAPRLELKAAAYADVGAARSVSLSVTITNVGHRAAIAAIRARMLGFVVEGPDGPVDCAWDSHLNVPREGYQTLKPGGATTLTILAVEACGQDLFRRPGLYRVTPTIHLSETGEHLGIAAITGPLKAPEPMLVRIATGPDPFYVKKPQVVRAPHPDTDESGGGG